MSVGIGAREGDSDFKVPAGKAELVPALQHAALVLKVICLLVLDLDPESTISGSDLAGIIPFQVFGDPVLQVDSFPKGVVTGVEGAAVGIKLVREDENIILSIPSGPCLDILRGIIVNHIACLERDLRVECFRVVAVGYRVGTQEAAIPGVHLVIAHHGIADEEGEEGGNQ